ncbi:MAG: ABC transporter permease [Gammaproteobacteria bacterium]|nr:ABC transporter permease [Gammaproteobacteria bacterium]
MNSFNIKITRLLVSRHELIFELVRRELKDRHTGQIVGVVWSFGHPVLLMALYAVLFAYVFPARFADGGFEADFSANILAGIICWLAFQDILSRSPSILLSHANLVKQIVFPIEVLPVKTAIASLLPFAGSLIFAIAYSAFKDTLSFFSIALPLLILVQIVAMVGIAFILSVVGVYLKDIKDLIVVFNAVNLFAQPILYNPRATPEILQWIFVINPFSYAVWCWQDVLFYGTIAHPVAWIVFPLESLLLLVFGWSIFERSKNTLGDHL